MAQPSREGFHIQPVQPWWGTPEDDQLHIVLVAPEIPGNTGNIGRLCAGARMWLHLVKPLGFELDNKRLRRAGLDYWPHVQLCVHESFDEIDDIFGTARMHLFTKFATTRYDRVTYRAGDLLIFGRETIGLGAEMRDRYAERLVRIPITDKVRSLNLSNACAVVTYEALRQLDFAPLTP